MKRKVALLGDSIRLMGYGQLTTELLGENVEVFSPEDNCRFAKYLLRGIFEWRDILKDCEVIHWNCGLWDVCSILGDDMLFTSDEEYVENIMRIATLLKKITPNVIFATTTPVRENHPHNKNSDIERFNVLVVPKLKELGVQINDLYAIVADDIQGNICDDLIHLSPKGIELCAKQVAEMIADNLHI